MPRYEPYFLDHSLVGYWKLDESGGDVVYDSSRYKNHGTVYGAIPTSHTLGYSFDGVNDYINTGILYNTSLPFTLSGWAKTNDKSLQQAFIGNVGNAGTNRLYMGVRTGNYWIGIGITQKYTISASAITNNVWFHWILVGTGLPDRISYYYINGNQVDTVAYAGTSQQTEEPLYIGAINADPNSSFFNGSIDEVRIYNRALSTSEITKLFNQYRGKFGI